MSIRSLFAFSLLASLCSTRLALAQEPSPAAIPAKVQPMAAAAPAEQAATDVAGAALAQPVAAEQQSADLRGAPARVQPLSSPLHTVSSWYGWQTLMADGAWLLVSVAAVGAGATGGPSEALGWVSLGGYFLGGPIVHFGHGNVGKGLGSLALRSGLPILAGGIGAKAATADCGGGEWCGVGGALIGGLAGVVGAIVLDAAVLGYERVPERNSTWPIVGVASDGERTLVTAQGRF
jgi:hypothetical protein